MPRQIGNHEIVLASSNISEADKASADMAFLRVGKRQSRARV